MFTEKITYQTYLNSTIIQQYLKEYVEPERFISFNWNIFASRKPLTGEFSHNYFQMWRTPRPKSGVFAFADGIITQNPQTYTTTIYVEFKMAFLPSVIFFLSAIGTIAMLLFLLSSLFGESFEVQHHAIIFVPIFAMLFATVGFWYDKWLLKTKLENIFRMEKVKE